MKTNTPPSYYNIFPIYTGSALNQYIVPPHRGLFVSSGTTNVAGITVENFDGTTAGFPVIANTAVVVPLTIKKITAAASISNCRISGLL